MAEYYSEKEESNHIFLSFCSLMCIIHGKKLNLPNIFLLVLKNLDYKRILRNLLTIDNDYELFKFFIEYDSSISKSKYISKYLNSNQGVRIKKNVYGFSKASVQRTPKRVKKGKKPTIQIKKRFHKNRP